MSFTKTLDNDLKVSLLTEDPFLYAHLVKFENVPDDASGRIGGKRPATILTYQMLLLTLSLMTEAKA